jgi:hypothetical protein
VIKKMLLVFLLLVPCLQTAAQAGTGPSHFDMTGFPQWSKDLRRGEIVALGSFPFAYFFTTFFYDTYLCASHQWDSYYAPWPAKPSAAYEYKQSEHWKTLGVAAGVSVSIALADYFIVRHKRNKQEQQNKNIPAEIPVIIRRPLNEVIETSDEIGEIYEKPEKESDTP